MTAMEQKKYTKLEREERIHLAVVYFGLYTFGLASTAFQQTDEDCAMDNGGVPYYEDQLNADQWKLIEKFRAEIVAKPSTTLHCWCRDLEGIENRDKTCSRCATQCERVPRISRLRGTFMKDVSGATMFLDDFVFKNNPAKPAYLRDVPPGFRSSPPILLTKRLSGYGDDEHAVHLRREEKPKGKVSTLVKSLLKRIIREV